MFPFLKEQTFVFISVCKYGITFECKYESLYFSDMFESSLGQGGSESVNITSGTLGIHQLCTLLMDLRHMFHDSVFANMALGCRAV